MSKPDEHNVIDDIKRRLDFFNNEIKMLSDNRYYVYEKQVIYEESEMQNRIACMVDGLRSVLDYTMSACMQSFKPKHSQFPLYNYDRKRFEEFMKRHNKELPQNHYTYAKLEKLQYYNDKSSKKWMKMFHDLSNKSKHAQLPKIVRKNERQVVVHSSDGYAPIIIDSTSRIIVRKNPGFIINGEEIYFTGEVSVSKFPHINHKNISMRSYAFWCFEESGTSVKHELHNIHNQIEQIRSDLLT